MGSLRFADIQTRPTEGRDLTQSHRRRVSALVLRPLRPRSRLIWPTGVSMGKRRTARRYTTDQNCPRRPRGSAVVHPGVPEDLPPPRRCRGGCSGWARAKPISGFMPLGGAAGDAARAGGCPDPVLDGVGDAPRGGRGRSGGDGRADGHAACGGAGTVPAAPLWATMAPNGASSAPRIRLSRRAVIAARKRATRSRTCC